MPLGFDCSVPVSVDAFRILKDEHGYRLFIGRVWMETNNFDEEGIQNIKNAWEAGMEMVDGYLFPSVGRPNSAPVANQVEATINKLREVGARINILWLDIEPSGQQWPDKAASQQLIREMVEKAQSMNCAVGIYTSQNNWEQMVGGDWSEMAHLPLWYAHWTGQQSFDGFVPFGGWTPQLHQYQGDTPGPCGFNIDLNWWPD